MPLQSCISLTSTIYFRNILNMYSQVGVRVRTYVNRIHNEALKILKEPRIRCLLDGVHEKVGQPPTSRGFLNITDVASKLGIPQNYIVEVLAINFVLMHARTKLNIIFYPQSVEDHVSIDVCVVSFVRRNRT